MLECYRPHYLPGIIIIKNLHPEMPGIKMVSLMLRKLSCAQKRSGKTAGRLLPQREENA